MHDLGAVLREFVHLFERSATDHVRGRNATRIGGHRSADVGVNIDAIGAQCMPNRDRREIRAAATQGRNRAVFGRALKARDHRHRATLEQRAHRMRLDAQNLRVTVRAVGHDAGLRPGHRLRLDVHCAQFFGKDRGRNQLATSQEHIRVRAAGIAADQAEQRIGGVG